MHIHAHSLPPPTYNLISNISLETEVIFQPYSIKNINLGERGTVEPAFLPSCRHVLHGSHHCLQRPQRDHPCYQPASVVIALATMAKAMLIEI